MKKSLVSIAVTFLLIFSSFALVPEESEAQTSSNYSFIDNPPGSSFYNAVNWMAASGITVGYSDGTFKKNRYSTRGETVAFLHRYINPYFVTPGRSPYRDMSVSSAFFSSVAWASSAGVTGGYADGTFRPNKNVTRGEFAAFVYRLHGANYSSDRGREFSDVSGFAYHPANWMKCYGISVGYSDGTFKPNKPITRGEMSALLYQYNLLNASGALEGDCTQAKHPLFQLTFEQEQALGQALELLEYGHYSKAGLVTSLGYFGFSEMDARKAVENVVVDWNLQALGQARELLEYSHYSRTDLQWALIEIFEFTPSQAKYAVDRVGY